MCPIEFIVILVHGGWCDWTEYSECRPSDKKAFRIQTRDCQCPRPENGGRLCIGEQTYLHISCNDNRVAAEFAYEKREFHKGPYTLHTKLLRFF